MGAYSNSLNKGVVGFLSCIIQMVQLTNLISRSAWLIGICSISSSGPWRLSFALGRQRSTKILEFIFSFSATLKYLGLGLVEKMSIALPICRECGAAVQGLGKTKVYQDCGLEGTLFLKAIRGLKFQKNYRQAGSLTQVRFFHTSILQKPSGWDHIFQCLLTLFSTCVGWQGGINDIILIINHTFLFPKTDGTVRSFSKAHCLQE